MSMVLTALGIGCNPRAVGCVPDFGFVSFLHLSGWYMRPHHKSHHWWWKERKQTRTLNTNIKNSPRSLKGFLGEKEREGWILHRSDMKRCESTDQDRQCLAPAAGLQKGRLKTPLVNLRSLKTWSFPGTTSGSHKSWQAGSVLLQQLSQREEEQRRGRVIPTTARDQRDSAWWDESWDQRRISELLDRHLHRDPECKNSYLKVIFVLAAWDSSLVSIITSSRALVYINHLKTYGTSHDCYIFGSF